MFALYVASIEPLFVDLLATGPWPSAAYLVLVSLVVPVYWPSATYRMLLLIASSVAARVPTERFTVLDDDALPSVAIVVPVRNEPREIVVPLLGSLLALDYPDYDVVLADNSDIVDGADVLNEDFVSAVAFVLRHGDRVRFVRRGAPGSAQIPSVGSVPEALWALPSKGERLGGKAANINEAISSCDAKYEWVLILDADSRVDSGSLRRMASIAQQASQRGVSVGFVQSVLVAVEPDESPLTRAQSILDDIYHRSYFRVKTAAGLVSNLGHGVLISRAAWRRTKGIPLEISEDLAWANELLLCGEFRNYYAIAETGAMKPSTWPAFRVQRHRWAKGTTIQLRRKLAALWTSNNIRWHEKLDLTYDMTSYALTAAGCLLPSVFLASEVLPDAAQTRLFATLVPVFYMVMALDNLLLPLEAGRLLLRGRTDSAARVLRTIPLTSIFYGGIAAEVLRGVVAGVRAGEGGVFAVTPKGRPTRTTRWGSLRDSGLELVLGVVNGWVTVKAATINPWIVPLLVLSPIAYFSAPLFGRAADGPMRSRPSH